MQEIPLASATDPRRPVYIALGLLSLGLGALGAVLPGLPTTIFLLAASYLFARSSPRLHRRLVEHPKLGAYIRDAEARRMTRRAKVTSLCLMWTSIGVRVALMAHVNLWIRALVVVLGLIGSGFICLYMRTAEADSPATGGMLLRTD